MTAVRQLDERHLWRTAVLEAVSSGARFAGVYCTDIPDGCILTAIVVEADGQACCLRTQLPPGDRAYPSLSTDLAAAFWYERALHDLSGVVPEGHPRLDPLLLPRAKGAEPPRPGRWEPTDPVVIEDVSVEEPIGPMDVTGRGVFTLPLGPVRSGVMESLELLIETAGEDIPRLTIRPHYKHRGMAKRFEGRMADEAVLVAERIEGINSVAHALAFSHAVEHAAGVDPPPFAQLVRVLYAECERLANHLDVTIQLCDAAGLAVASSRFAWHKELVMRWASALTGSRFLRGTITPGGLNAAPLVEPGSLTPQIARLGREVRNDIRALEGSASFLDRLRGTGLVAADLAASHGAVGPIGRGSGQSLDVRLDSPYDGYPLLPALTCATSDMCDALARARVRWQEIDTSLELIQQVISELPAQRIDLRSTIPAVSSQISIGSSESASGEVLYAMELLDGRVQRCFARCASLHNLVLLHDAFHGDVYTDLPFIEASFGLSYAGVAM